MNRQLPAFFILHPSSFILFYGLGLLARPGTGLVGCTGAGSVAAGIVPPGTNVGAPGSMVVPVGCGIWPLP
jgi:hypothetical protein